MLRDLGGARVILYMPMVPEAVIATLAARRRPFRSVACGAANRPHRRRQTESDFSASCGLEPGRLVAYKPLLDEVTLAQHKPGACLILQRPQMQATLIEGCDHYWAKMRD